MLFSNWLSSPPPTLSPSITYHVDRQVLLSAVALSPSFPNRLDSRSLQVLKQIRHVYYIDLTYIVQIDVRIHV